MPTKKKLGRGEGKIPALGARLLLICLKMFGFKYKKFWGSRWKRVFEPAVDDS